jgi:hypothetical protein
MHSPLPAVLLCAALAGCAAPVQTIPGPQRVVRFEEDAFPPRGDLAVHGRQVNFGSGLRSFEDPDFGRLDDQIALTLDYCEPMDLGALRLEGGMHYSYDEADGTSGGQDVRLHGQAFELSVGLNFAHLLGRLRPYVGFGAAFQFLELRGIDEERDLVFDDDDVAIGGYAKGGLLFQVSRTNHLGIEIRHFEGGDVTLDGTDLETSYDQVLLVFGTSFE